MAKTEQCCGDLADWLSADVFRALSEPNRLSILARLADCAKEMTVSDVAQCCPVDISVVSRHLRTLKDAGVLEAEKKGKEVFYRVKARELVQFLRGLADALEKCCGEQCGSPGSKQDE